MNLSPNPGRVEGFPLIVRVVALSCCNSDQALNPFLSFECSHFGVAEPQFALAEELKVDIAHHEAMWNLYEEFSSGLEELAKEDWISFR